MRKIREILRLHALGYSVRDIGRSCGVAASTVSLCLQRAAAAGLTWPLPTDLDETGLEQRLYRRPALPPAAHRPQPDWARLDQELRQKGVTLLQLWDEYRQQTPTPPATPSSVTTTTSGGRPRTWCSARSTKPARSASSTTRGRPSPLSTPTPGKSGPPSCSWPAWAPAITPMSKRLPRRTSPRGFWPMCTPSRSSAAFRRWSCRTTPRPGCAPRLSTTRS